MKLKWRKLEERLFLAITGLVAFLVASMLILIIGKIALEASPVINLYYLTTSEVQDMNKGHAIGNAIAGTILISLLSVTLATPLSVATAVYMKRYAKDNTWTRTLSFLLDVLSGTPSIIMGVFGLLVFVAFMGSITGGFSLISGSMALAILIMPVIEKASESAIDTVPIEYEHGSYALGSNLWQTIRGITIPYALPGIITGVILGVGRACEESAVVILTSGYTQFFPSFGIQHSNKLIFGIQILPLQSLVATLPITVYNDYERSNRLPQEYAFAAAFVLIVIVMMINLSARVVLWRFKMGAKRSPLLPAALTVGGRKVFKHPIVAKAAPIMLNDGAGNENKVGKMVRWLTTDPKKEAAKKRGDTTVITNMQAVSSTSTADEHPVAVENTIVNVRQPEPSMENESSIYSLEATNKTIEAMNNREAHMPESTSSSSESNRPLETHVEEVINKSDDQEPELKTDEPTELSLAKDNGDTIKSVAGGDEDKFGKFVKWLTTDPKKENAKKNEQDKFANNAQPMIALPEPQQQASPRQESPVSQGASENMPHPATVQKNSSGLEIIPPAAVLREKKKSATNPDLVVYPSRLPPVTKEPGEVPGPKGKKDDGKAGGIVKWFLTDPKKEVAKKNEPAAAKDKMGFASTASTLPVPAQMSQRPAQSGLTPSSQASSLSAAESQNGDNSEVISSDVEQGVTVYSPQSPPSMQEVSETLGKTEKKNGKVGEMVKWLLADPKKDSTKAKSIESPVNATASNVIDTDINKIYSVDDGGASESPSSKVKASKINILLPNIFSGNSSKQKNSNEMPEFVVGKLSQPTLEGSIKDTECTYAIDPPFQYVHIFFDGEELVYNVMEPVLGEAQKRYMSIIERGLEKLISSKIVAIKPEEREQFLRQKFDDIIKMYGWNLNEAYKDRMFYYLRKRYLGYDKIDVIMKDHFIEDISCNGPNSYVYIFHRIYGSVRTNVSYGDVELNKFVMRMAQISGRHISILQPIKDISLPDGSRANLTLGTEVTKKGATFTIRKFKDRPISPIELLDYGSIDPRALAYLWTLLDYKRSILVSGGTASGKTTLMNALCTFIRPELKIVSLEDTPELNLVHPNWIQSVTRSGFGAESSGGSESVSGVSGISVKSPGNIGLYDLLVAALRQRPEYIIVGEVRGAEAFTLFQAIAVGHAAMGTVHAGNMRELLSRVESNPMNVPRTLFAAMDVVCFSAMVRRGDRNIRRIMQIVEILELDTEGNLITNPVFRWDAFSDRFIFTGKSHIFEKIEALLGIRQEALIKEMDNRASFLLKLRNEGIRDYTTVVENIREYELSKITGNTPEGA